MPERTEYADGIPCWVDLGTPDVEGSKAFYAAILGWEYETGGPEYGGYVTATLRGKVVAGMMAIGEGAGEGGGPPAWSSYIATSKLDETYANALAAGATSLVEPMDIPVVGRMAFVMDPTGAAIGMWQAAEHIGAELVNEPGTWCWNELVCNDIPTAAAFYATVFGWQTQSFEMGPDAPPYTVWASGPNQEDGFAGAMAPPMEGLPNYWGVYFAVADVDATVAQATSLGATLLTPAFDTPAGRIAPFLDPQGVAVNFIQNPEPS